MLILPVRALFISMDVWTVRGIYQYGRHGIANLQLYKMHP